MKPSNDIRLEMEAARNKRQPFSVGDKVNIHPYHTETNAVLGKGEILSTSNMDDDFYSVLWRHLIRKKRFYPMAGKNPDMYCTTPCIMVTCEAGSELSLLKI